MRFESGSYIVISEYGKNKEAHKGEFFDAIFLDTGEYYAWRNPDEWVAIIDMDDIETDAAFEAEYPPQPPQKENEV